MKNTPSIEKGIIRPKKGKRDPRIGTDALMVAVPTELRSLAKWAQAEKVSFNEMNLYHLYLSRRDHDPPIALSGPFLGAPHAVMGMEKLIVLGATRIWFLGWCGSIQPDLQVGDLVLPTGAVSEEGTSRHYPVGNRDLLPDPLLVQHLGKRLEAEGQSFSKGRIWTTDAPYRETPKKVKRYQRMGILAVEMETSALMNLALYRSVQMTALLVVSDALHDLTWHPGFSNPALKKNSKRAARVLFNMVRSLNRKEQAVQESP